MGLPVVVVSKTIVDNIKFTNVQPIKARRYPSTVMVTPNEFPRLGRRWNLQLWHLVHSVSEIIWLVSFTHKQTNKEKSEWLIQLLS